MYMQTINDNMRQSLALTHDDFVELRRDYWHDGHQHCFSLLHACMTNNIELARSRISCGDDINQKDQYDPPAIMIAATWGSDLVLDYLLDNNAIIDEPISLMIAINMGVPSPHIANNRTRSAMTIERILTTYPNIDLNKTVNVSHHYNLLSAAAMSDYTNSVHTLLKHGANPNASSPWHNNPLMFATSNANPMIVRELLLHDANPNVEFDQLHPIMCCLTNISTYAFTRPMRISTKFSGYLGLQAKVNPSLNLACFLILITHGSRYKCSNELVWHIEQHIEIKNHMHYKIMSSCTAQEYYADLFNRIKTRWWVRKIIHSAWYERAIKKVYEPGHGVGYFSTMNDIDNLLQTT